MTPDYTLDHLISDYAKTLIHKHYLQPGELSPQDGFVRACEAYSGGDEGLAARLYSYVSRKWFMFASPVLSNAPKKGQPWKTLPASCFLQHIGDDRGAIVDARAEAAWLTFMGGGIGSHVSELRAAGPKSNGPIPFLHVMDSQMLSDKQAQVRRGSIAFYMDITSPDIEEFIAGKDPVGGDINRKLLNSNPAVNITDEFMLAVKEDLPWNLYCPHTKEVKKTVKARELWGRILDYRRKTGEPYICFIDTANRLLPEDYKRKGLKINGSNLCCVSGDQRVLTKEFGEMSVLDLYDSGVMCHVIGSSGGWIKTKTPMQLIAREQPLLRISTHLGASHTITLNHKVAVPDLTSTEPGLLTTYRQVEARELKIGDVLANYTFGNKFVVDHITSITEVPPADVYCWEVDAEDHLWVCNGILTRNSEIFIPTSPERTAVCVLSSVNLEKWEEWKDDPMFIGDLITMLDNVVDKFIENCPEDKLPKAKLAATLGRDIGLGAMGLHSLFQSKGIAFESLAAKMLNKQVFKHIWEQAQAQTRKLAIEKGPAPDSVDGTRRNILVMAVAPTSNNSIIIGTSPSVEPWLDNAFVRDTRIGQEIVKNPYLWELLDEKGYNTDAVWKSIIANGGSVLHLADILTDEERDVFKTAFEIDQRWIVDLAADRQEFIDQGQSINLFFDAAAPKKYISTTHFEAWEKGLKALYYCRSKALVRPDLGTALERKALGGGNNTSPSEAKHVSVAIGEGGCLSCEG